MTKEERREYQRKWRAEHKEHIKAYRREYYIKHFWDRKDYPVNPEVNRKAAKSYYERHKNDEDFKARIKAAQKRWREKNRDKWNAYYREYRNRKKLEGGRQ